LPTSSSPSAELREFAFVPDRYTRTSADARRHDDGRVCILQGNTWAAISGVRVAADEVEALLEEVRALVPAEKTQTWWLDPAAQPSDVYDRLVALGLDRPEDRGDEVHALVCTAEPAPGPANVVVRRVETFEDDLVATELQWEVFETPADRREARKPHLRDEFEAARAAGTPVTFLADLDGRPAGVARSIYSDRGVFLIAGAVAGWARGRGVYRALVRARWEDAVQRQTPALVTEALPDTSYPILLGLGFVDVGTTRRLEDKRR
jgi:hypothetical protein